MVDNNGLRAVARRGIHGGELLGMGRRGRLDLFFVSLCVREMKKRRKALLWGELSTVLLYDIQCIVLSTLMPFQEP